MISGLLLFSILANAQNGNTSLTVSKGVQQVANKKAFANEITRKSHIQANSVEFPAIVVSKGIFRPVSVPMDGNIASKGYPAWAISKGVARKNVEYQQKTEKFEEYPSDRRMEDSRQISKR